jgi:hypothetical protein
MFIDDIHAFGLAGIAMFPETCSTQFYQEAEASNVFFVLLM